MKKDVFVLILVFLLLAISSEAKGIGMRSGSLMVDINFVPNFEHTYYYSVIPYTDEPMDVTMYAENDNDDGTISDLSKYFVVEPNMFKEVLPKQEPFFSLTVRLPNEIKEPGTHKLHVGVAEALPTSGGIAVRAAVEAIFYIHVPYDGQYLTYSMDAENVNQGTPIPIKLTLANLGKEPINELHGEIVLFDSGKNEIDRIKTDIISLKSQKNTVLTLEIKTIGIPAGEYFVNATVYYDGKKISRIKNVKIGELKLKIINQTQEIIAGKVNEIFVEIESEWAELVKNIYAKIQIGNQQPVKTLNEDLFGFKKTRLKAFFDAADIKPGTYDMNIKLYYEEKMTSKTVAVNVVKGESSAKGNISFTNILLMIIILVVIIINIILFAILLKKKDEHEKK